jgi:hypothetical protein
VNDASRHADAQHRVAKNPLQLCQHNPLMFRCLHVCQAIWLNTVGFGQTRDRKFSGVCGWRASINFDEGCPCPTHTRPSEIVALGAYYRHAPNLTRSRCVMFYASFST